MATTTNYGWDTPDDTDLVKDGAAAIRTLGSSVDTTTKALNPSTTEGDIEYRSATANTNTRLGIGTAGQVLQVNSGADAPEWVTISTGGMTLISTTTLSGATTTISSIPQTYTKLYAVFYGVTNATTYGAFRLAPNGVTNLSTCIYFTANQAFAYIAQNYFLLASGQTGYSPTFNNANNAGMFEIENYASSSNYKTITSRMTGFSQNRTDGNAWSSNGGFNSNTEITSLVFSNSGGDLSTGTVLLYGVK